MKKVQKNLLITLIIVAGISLVSGLIYFLFFFNPSGSGETINEIDTNETSRTLFPISQPAGENGQALFGAGQGGESSKLRQLSTVPTAGSVSFNREKIEMVKIDETGQEKEVKTTETVFRYIERGTGHLYEVISDDSTQVRLSNTTIPKIHDALFSRNGNNVILRSLDESLSTELTYLATLKDDGESEPSLNGYYLANDIDQIDSFGEYFFYSLKNIGGGAEFYEGSFSSSEPKKVYSSKLSEWLVDKVSDVYSVITSKPSGEVEGMAYLLNVNTGATEKIAEGVRGLTVSVSPDMKYALGSDTSSGVTKNFIINLQTGSRSSLDEVHTLADKCVWSQQETGIVYCGSADFVTQGTYPDDWYLGVRHFDDNLYKIDAKTSLVEFVFISKEYMDAPLDIIKPNLSPNEDYILFINKNDLTLWSFELN